MILLYILLFLTLLSAISIIYRSLQNGIPPMPSNVKAMRAIVVAVETEAHRLFEKKKSNSVTIMEPGSGWGNVSIALARSLPWAHVAGYENSPIPFLASIFFSKLSWLSNVSFHYADYRNADFTKADIIICYLHREGMQDIARLTGRSSFSSITTLRSAPPSLKEYLKTFKTEDGKGMYLKDSLKPVIISNTFSLPDLPPDRVKPIESSNPYKILIYR